MPSPLSICAIIFSLPLSSFPPFTLIINRSEPFLKKSKLPYLSHTNPHGQRHADCLHGATSHWLMANLKPVLCCPSLTASQSVPLRSFGRNLDVYRIDRFYCVHFLPYFDLDSPTLHSMFSPLALDFILWHSLQWYSPSSCLHSTSYTLRQFSKTSHFWTLILLHSTLRDLLPTVDVCPFFSFLTHFYL